MGLAAFSPFTKRRKMQRGGTENGKTSLSKFPAVFFLYLPISPRIQYLSFFFCVLVLQSLSLSLSVVRRYIRYIHSCPVKLDAVPVRYTKHADHLRREKLAGRCS